jgi:Fe-S-cluster containining protein
VTDSINPCLSCGACCARYRVSFYWAEVDDATPGGVPAELTEKLGWQRRVMKGTNRPHPRCEALVGEIGRAVSCAVYERRPQVCRELEASWSQGRRDGKCDEARRAWGFAPLER